MYASSLPAAMQKGMLIVAALLAAGCVAPAAQDLPVETAAVAADEGEAFRVPVAGGPDAILTAAWWTIPASAVVPWTYNDEFDVNESVVAVEGSLVLPEGAEVTRWAVFAFRVEDGELFPSAVVGSMPTSGVVRSALSAQPFEEEAVVAPFLTRLAMDVKAGERIGLVVALETPEPVEGSFVFRTLAEDPAGDEEPAEDAATFVASLPAAAPVDLPVAAVGEGFHVDGYFEFNVGLPYGWGVQMRTGEVEVDEVVAPVDPRPLPHARRLAVAAESPTDAGWGAVDAYALADAGVWRAQAQVRGQEAVSEGPLVASSLLVGGYAWVGGLGDGEGPLAASMRVDGATVNLDSLGLVVLGFAETLEALLGVPGASDLHAASSLVSFAAAGDDLRIQRGNVEWVLVGALPPR